MDVVGRELWIHGHIPGTVEYARRWERVPPWSVAGQPLAKAAHSGYEALDRAVRILNRAARNDPPPSIPLGWPPVEAQRLLLPARRSATERPASVRLRTER